MPAKLTDEEKQQIFNEKGFNSMKKRLKPEIIQTDKSILAITSINMKNTLGALDRNGEFCLLTIDNDGIIDINVVLPGHPEKKSFDLYSDSINNNMWVVRGRGLYFIYLETKNTAHVIASNDGNGAIYTVFTAYPKERIMGIVFTNCSGCSTNLLLYDLPGQKRINELNIGSGRVYPYYDNKILTCFYEKKDGKKTKIWNFYGYFAKGLADLYTDKLIEQLTKTQMDSWQKSKTIHLEKQMMLCYTLLNYDLTYFSVRWDKEREDIKIEPIILQTPKNKILEADFVFSQDGNWV